MVCGDESYMCFITIWLFNIAMENDPFIDDFPKLSTSMYKADFPASSVSHNQMVNPHQIPLNHHFPMVFPWFSYGFPMLVITRWYHIWSRDPFFRSKDQRFGSQMVPLPVWGREPSWARAKLAQKKTIGKPLGTWQFHRKIIGKPIRKP